MRDRDPMKLMRKSQAKTLFFIFTISFETSQFQATCTCVFGSSWSFSSLLLCLSLFLSIMWSFISLSPSHSLCLTLEVIVQLIVHGSRGRSHHNSRIERIEKTSHKGIVFQHIHILFHSHPLYYSFLVCIRCNIHGLTVIWCEIERGREWKSNRIVVVNSSNRTHTVCANGNRKCACRCTCNDRKCLCYEIDLLHILSTVTITLVSLWLSLFLSLPRFLTQRNNRNVMAIVVRISGVSRWLASLELHELRWRKKCYW